MADPIKELEDAAEPTPGGFYLAAEAYRKLFEMARANVVREPANFTAFLVSAPESVQEAMLGVDRAANLREAWRGVLRITQGTAPTEEVHKCPECQRPWDAHAEACSKPAPF